MHRLTPTVAPQEFFDWWLAACKRIRKEMRKGFDSLVVLVAWSIWKERNQRVFQKVQLPPTELADLILDEAKLWYYAGLTHLLQLFPCLESRVLGSGAVITLGRDLVTM